MSTTIDELPRTTTAVPTVTLYGPPSCPGCERAAALLSRSDVAFTKVTIVSGDADHRYVTEDLGYRVAPVVVVDLADGRTVHWGGHREDMLRRLVRLCTHGVQDPTATRED